ncbi:hypothetical protein CVV38_01805 [Candidatus Peregrinibacteria bacterium HGW-Peregrinibacteria-1]|jgi:sulfur carrier protein ThiS|nr:MAG: hypothetical protein CVV38_01805 [Candidatus Peregrinibacteria bacterium HGW-Peregrinibacteria-1]
MSLKKQQNKVEGGVLRQVVVGILGGLICLGIFHFVNTAYGNTPVFQSGKGLNWADVFGGGAQGQDLYLLVKSKKQDVPEQRAVSDMAKSFGFTTSEVVALREGSLIPLFAKNGDRTNFTQADALAALADFKEQYDFLYDLYEVRSDIELSIMPGELFANGDLQDSGFDLIWDLERIEEVLFEEVSERTVYNSSFTLPEGSSEQEDDDRFGFEDAFNGSDMGLGVNSSINDGVITSVIGDTTVDVELLEIDFCELPADDNAIDLSTDPIDLGDFDVDFGIYTGSGSFGGMDLGIPDVFDTEGELVPAKADDWSKEWCPGILSNTGNYSTFGESGFSSLGSVANSSLDQSAFVGAADSGDLFSAHVALCLSTTTVKDTMSLFADVDRGCVLCNIKEINAAMDQVLSHSLIPNKVTGNWGESAKCKTAFSTPVVDMNFITVATPVPTQFNDDLIFDRNIFEEFKLFTDTYKPVLWSDLGLDKQIAVSSTTFDAVNNNQQSDLWASAKRESDIIKASAQKELDTIAVADDALNLNVYAKTLADQLRQMTAYFEGYNAVFNEIGDICSAVQNKDYIN